MGLGLTALIGFKAPVTFDAAENSGVAYITRTGSTLVWVMDGELQASRPCQSFTLPNYFY